MDGEAAVIGALYSASASDSGEEGAYEESPFLEEMTLAELRAFAKRKGLTGYSAMNKEELIVRIRQEG